MTMSPVQFLRQIAEEQMPILERALGLLLLAGLEDHSAGLSARQIAEALHAAGYAKQNISRLDAALKSDRRTVKCNSTDWRLSPKARLELSKRFVVNAKPAPLPERDSVLPHGIFPQSRAYINRVVYQINQSYDHELFDCCAVMCRRLLETLIIEVYECRGQSDKLRGTDGNFFMLSALIGVVESDQSLGLSRNGTRGLKDFKALGDLSAHNRRFNARASDIDRVRSGLRVAVEELLHLAQSHAGANSADRVRTG